MTTQERNILLSSVDSALLHAIMGFIYDDGESETSELLELVYVKISNAIDTLRLPEGRPG
jgi:hypothetical protein